MNLTPFEADATLTKKNFNRKKFFDVLRFMLFADSSHKLVSWWSNKLKRIQFGQMFSTLNWLKLVWWMYFKSYYFQSLVVSLLWQRQLDKISALDNAKRAMQQELVMLNERGVKVNYNFVPLTTDTHGITYLFELGTHFLRMIKNFGWWWNLSVGSPSN